jgi:hypothetical protein
VNYDIKGRAIPDAGEAAAKIAKFEQVCIVRFQNENREPLLSKGSLIQGMAIPVC